MHRTRMYIETIISYLRTDHSLHDKPGGTSIPGQAWQRQCAPHSSEMPPSVVAVPACWSDERYQPEASHRSGKQGPQGTSGARQEGRVHAIDHISSFLSGPICFALAGRRQHHTLLSQTRAPEHARCSSFHTFLCSCRNASKLGRLLR